MSALKKVEAEGEPRNLDGFPPSRTGLKGGSGGPSRFYMTSSSSGGQFGNGSGNGNGGVSREADNSSSRTFSEKSSSSFNTEQTSSSFNGGGGGGAHGRRRSSTSTSRTSVPTYAEDADDANDETLSNKGYMPRPMGPPRFTPKDEAELLADQVADNILGGWHYAPLIIALAPPIGAVLGGKAEHWSNALLVLLGSFWLYQFLRVPWEMYYAVSSSV